MIESQSFPFLEAKDIYGDVDVVPNLPLTLIYGQNSIAVSGLLDTGASVNVLPYSVGCDLGAIWEEQNFSVQLAGNLATVEAKGLVLSAQIGDFQPVTLVFAWSQTDDVPILLGRMNFFLEFDVCFYRSRSLFELRPKSSMV
jgi:hypothetical protein